MELYGSIVVITLKYLFLSIICFLTLFYFYVSRDYDYWKKRGVQYKKPFFCFGNMEFFMRRSMTDFLCELEAKYKGPYVGMFLGHKPTLIVQDAELARKILIKETTVFQNRHLYCGETDPLGALNLFTVKNPVWKDMRRQLTPMFTSARLRDLSHFMNINAEELISRIQREHVDKNKPVHLKDLLSRYTSDIVGYTIFGLRTNALRQDDNPLWFISTNIVKSTFWRGFELSLCFLIPDLANFLRCKFFSKPASEYIKKIFLDQVKERQESGIADDRDFVDLLLKIKDTGRKYSKEFRENLMMAQVAVFIFDAIETSSATISYCLHELAYHQNEQEKLFNEIEDTIRDIGKEVLDFDDTLEMRYLNSCIQETLRKHPPAPYLDRICEEDYQIDEQLRLKRGTPVLINVVGIHHNPEYYAEPEVWNPDRFTGVNPDNELRNFTFLPFGSGPRYCIGKRYATAQVRAALVQIIHKYKLEPVAKYHVVSDPYSVTLAPKNGGSVRFVPRNVTPR